MPNTRERKAGSQHLSNRFCESLLSSRNVQRTVKVTLLRVGGEASRSTDKRYSNAGDFIWNLANHISHAHTSSGNYDVYAPSFSGLCNTCRVTGGGVHVRVLRPLSLETGESTPLSWLLVVLVLANRGTRRRRSSNLLRCSSAWRVGALRRYA